MLVYIILCFQAGFNSGATHFIKGSFFCLSPGANKYIFPVLFPLYFSAKKAQIETVAWFIAF